MRSRKIETFRKMYHKEWLLIAVDKIDKATHIPLTGKLIAHSPHRDEIYQLEMTKKKHTLTVYSEDGFPKGYAAAFYEK